MTLLGFIKKHNQIFAVVGIVIILCLVGVVIMKYRESQA